MNRRLIILVSAIFAVVVVLGLVLLRPEESGTGGRKPPPDEKKKAVRVITVSTAKEFIAAVGSDRVIRLAPGEYVISNTDWAETDFARRRTLFGSKSLLNQPVFHDVRNLTIAGLGERPVRILSGNSIADVLSFRNSAEIRLWNIEVGHTTEVGPCDDGGVLALRDCRDVRVESSVLFGCGAVGLKLSNVDGLEFADSVIRECTQSIMTVVDSRRITFRRSRFEKNVSYIGMYIDKSAEILFDDCEVKDNDASSGSALFNILSSEKVRIMNSRIEGNRFGHLLRRPGTAEFTDCVIKGNKFRKALKAVEGG